MGYVLPDSRITVYTSGVKFEAAIGDPPKTGEPLEGAAEWSKDGLPIVYVKLRHRGRPVEDDPLVTLIHELLHHVVRPELDHDEVYELSKQFRADDKASIIPAPPCDTDADTPDWVDRELSEMEQVRILEWLDDLWLEANGFPSGLPPRSLLTGRFMKRSIAADQPKGRPLRP
jgi:hypothetical protein